MGLIKEDNGFAVLSDILGDEDHLGDMDFKVAGTTDGLTALQMDIKIDGITTEIMQQALDQAKEGRLHILGEMAKVITEGRAEMSEYAPRLITFVEKAAGEEARRRVEQVTAEVEVGVIYEGKVAKIMDFGAFVNILPGKDGLVHISQISDERVEHVSDKLTEGDVVKVKVLEVDRQGRIRLSMKAVSEGEAAETA